MTPDLAIVVNHDINVIRCGGVEIHGLQTKAIPRQLSPDQAVPKLERYIFVPLKHETAADGKGGMERIAALTNLLQLVAENSRGAPSLKVVEIEGRRGSDALITPLAIQISASEPNYTLDITLSSNEILPEFLVKLGIKRVDARKSGSFQSLSDTHLVITTDLSERMDPTMWKRITQSLKPGGFVLAEETSSTEFIVPLDCSLIVVATMKTDVYSYTLLRMIEAAPTFKIIMVNGDGFSWVEPLKKALKERKTKDERILLVSQGEEFSGLKGLTVSLMKETGGSSVRSVVIQDPEAPVFHVNAPLYAKQLQLDLVSNVLNNAARNEWGTYRHIPLDAPQNVALRRVDCAYLKAVSDGNLSSLRWVEAVLATTR